MRNSPLASLSMSVRNDKVAGRIFHSRYTYYQLEGIPPYPSFFTPLEFMFDVWLDSENGARFRIQKTFRTLESETGESLVYLAVGDGLGNVWRAEIWDGKVTEQSFQETNHPKNYEEYRARERQAVTRILDKAIAQTERLRYKGVVNDERWGNVHLIHQQIGAFSGGTDLYTGWDHLREIKIRVNEPQILEESNWLKDVFSSAVSKTVLHSRYWQDLIEWIDASAAFTLFEPVFRIAG